MLADSAAYRNDYGTACPIYEKGAERGNVEAQINAGTCYYYGLGGFPEDRETGAEWWIRAARRGNTVARNKLFSHGIMWQRLFEAPPSDFPSK